MRHITHMEGEAEEVILGNNATTLTFHMARALASDKALNIGRGDNIVVTAMDHACNVGPWEALARDTGAQLRRIVFGYTYDYICV